jgi:putative endonuclease
MKAESKYLGAWGEALAAEYLRKKKYQLVAAGYHSRFGEIDLVVQNKRFLVFVEVKLRKNADFAKAMEYVDRRKQDKIRVTASVYLSQNPTNLQPRFDVIEIYAPEGTATSNPEIRHMEDAFQ